MITQTYNIDLVPNGKPLIVNVSQYDKLSRTLEFNVYSSGVLFKIPSGIAAVIQGTKPDGTGFSYNMTVSGSKVSMDIEQQMTVFDGDVHCEILLTKNAEQLGSANFILRVEKAAISDETIISETDMPIFRSFASGGSNGQVFVHGEGNEGNWETIETGGGRWGQITGTLSDQTDLNNVLSALNSNLSSATTAIASEASTRSLADTSLRQAIDALVSPQGQSVVVDNSLSISGAAADAKKTGDAVSNLTQNITDVKDALKTVPNGGTQLSSDLFVQIGEKDIGLKNPIYVSAGNKIITKQSALFMRWQIKDGAGNILEEKRGMYDKDVIRDEEYTFQHSGYFSITIANGHNWGNSSAIVPSDMTADIRVIDNMAEVIAENLRDVQLPEIKDNLKYLYTEILSEEESASSEDKFAYYPCKFISGQKYIVKIKFSEFVSTTNRKYSIRTTTNRYTTAPYLVNIVVIVDAVNPVVGQEYTYEFVATQKDGVNANYLALELNVNGSASCSIEAFSITAEDNSTAIQSLEWINAKDIVSLNHDALDLILDGKKPFNRASTVPLALLHFSDIHANQVNLERIVEMSNHLGADIDDTICTGDMVANNYSATGMDFWNAVNGAEKILMVVGNHDLADGQHGYSSDQIGQTVAYQTYFSPYVSNWGVTMAGTHLTYWYKDYANKKVRLIGLNYLLEGDASAAQRAWLIDRLAEAKTAGYAVVIAEHSPLNSFTEIPCNFNIIGKPWTYNEIKAQFQDAVQDFIDGGGEFACYISGHSHNDYVGYNSDYPQQICIAITTALTTGLDNDQRRVVNDKTQDAANVVIVDTVTKTVKLVRIGANTDTYLRGRNLFSIRYTDKAVIAQS